MHWRMATALALSVLLIGGASWMRYNRPTEVAAVSGTFSAAASNSDTASEPFDTASSSATSTDTEKLTDTDLISRQLFSEYVSLAANGQSTQTSLDALGDKYAQNISNLSKASTIMSSDVATVTNSTSTFAAYNNSLGAINTKYQAKLASLVPSSLATDPNGISPALANSMADLYSREATELEALHVPVALLTDHVKYVNLYLRHVWDMKAIANISADPIDATAAISAEYTSFDDEQQIAADMNRILMSGGIILNNQ